MPPAIKLVNLKQFWSIVFKNTTSMSYSQWIDVAGVLRPKRYFDLVHFEQPEQFLCCFEQLKRLLMDRVPKKFQIFYYFLFNLLQEQGSTWPKTILRWSFLNQIIDWPSIREFSIIKAWYWYETEYNISDLFDSAIHQDVKLILPQ